EHHREWQGRNARFDAAHREDPVVQVRFDGVPVVVGTRLDAGQPHGDVGDRNEQHFIQVSDALAAGEARWLAASGVIVEASEPDVTVSLVLDETKRTGPDELLQLAVPSRVDDLLRVDHGGTMGKPVEESSGRLLQMNHDLVGALGLDRCYRLPECFPEL